ncbi:MAG: peptidyl-tRNA hydrolase [candidate division TM6 bacterium GW2011_GWF2_32_72]|nr:MAG: peptidyl-tRNA hydrolase [candidate division TM6 bacterium GW2011_GWF2_32_72]
MEQIDGSKIKVIIGLGNPGVKYVCTRHNIGFLVLDELADMFGGKFRTKDNMELAEINIGGKKILLIKPQTFMNNSGQVIPFLNKQGIKPENILVVHDELELPFGKLNFKFGGSAKGHNGLRSIISACGPDYLRLRFGIGRPEDRISVGDYVLQPFTETDLEVESGIKDTAIMIEDFLKS